MGVSLGGSGQYLRRTANLPTSTAFTIAGWVKIRSVRSSAYQYFFNLESALSSATKYEDTGYNNTGGMEVESDVNTGAVTSPPTATWLFVYLKCSGTGAGNLESGWMGNTDTNFTIGSATGSSFTTVLLQLGNDSYDEWCNVDLRAIRVWNVALTDAELKAEKASTTLVKTANINAFWDLPSTSNYTDSSGNGRDLTVGGSLTTSVDDPPIYTQNINIAWWTA